MKTATAGPAAGRSQAGPHPLGGSAGVVAGRGVAILADLLDFTGDPGLADRAKVIMDGERAPLISLRPAVTPETRKATRRLALIALGTLFVAFVAYRLIYFRSQPIPFVEPKSPFTVEPASLPPAP